MDAMTELMRAFWVGGLAAIPLAAGVGLVCRARAWSAATRHLLWLSVLVSFVTPALGWYVWRPAWFGSEALLAAADHVIERLRVEGAERSRPAGTESVKPENIAGTALRGATDLGATSFIGPVLLPAMTPVNVNEQAARLAAPIGFAARAENFGQNGRDFSGGQGLMYSTRGASDAVNAAAPLGLAPMGVVRKEQPARARMSPNAARDVRANPIVVREKPPEAASGNEPAQGGMDFLRDWAKQLVAARGWVTSASPIPVALWLGVAGLLIAVRLARTFRAGRLIAKSEPAGLRTCAMVAVAAEQIGLSRVPEARMVDDAVSPMIWCGLRPKLILPRGLWNALDESSQRAVLVHELAHVRRFDHVLCWFDLAVGSLYWWHPISWWASRRLHDEAEASCDTWVVNTLPESRRAYATALLATKSFVSMKGRVNGPWLSAGGAGGIGVMSGSAERRARRITMVMTERVMTGKSASRKSAVGAGVAAIVIALGAFVMPGLACPPEEGASAAKAEKAAAELARASGGVIVVTPDGVVKERSKAKNKARGAGQGEAEYFGEAPALEAMKAKKGAKGFAPIAPVAPVTPVAPVAPVPALAPSVRGFPGVMMISPKAHGGKSGQCGVSRGSAVMSAEDYKAGRIAKVYVLPEGKSEAFWELMSRSDVPILVQQEGESIVVYATEAQHPTIAGFIKIINPDGRGSTNASEGDAVAGRDAAAAGRAAQQRAFQAQIRAYQQAVRGLHASRATVERNAARARSEADRIRSQQEEFESAAERMSEQASAMEEGAARQKLEAAADKLRQKAEAAENRGRSTEEQAENIEEQIEQIESRIEELEEQISGAEEEHDEAMARLDEEEEAMEEADAAEAMVVIDEDALPADAIVVDESMTEEMNEEMEEDEEIGIAVPAVPAIAPVAPVPPGMTVPNLPVPGAAPAAVPGAAPGTPAPASAPAKVPSAAGVVTAKLNA